MRCLQLGLAIAMLAIGGAQAAQAPSGTARATFFKWLEATDKHIPGERDEHLNWIAGLTRNERANLFDFTRLFGGFLRDPDGPVDRKTSRKLNVAELEIIRTVAKGRLHEINPLLHRAAVLHADAAVLLPELTRAENRKSEPPGNSRDEVLVADDGHFQGTSELNWNWRIGRQLLDDVEPMPPGDPFVARWYHATAAFMLANGHYAEVRPHLEYSTALTLNDARVVFDRACLFEALGTPRVQSVITGGTVRRDLHANVPLAKQANATAEQTFRQVLLLSPAHVEARIRLARLLELRGDGAEALKTLGTIAALPEDKILAYYAALFEGRAHQSLGRPDLAISHFSRAAEMFPRAQTARLALSHAAMIAGSVQLAAVPIDIIRAMGPNRDERDDPWWEYELGAGRDWYRLLDEMWRAVKR